MESKNFKVGDRIEVEVSDRSPRLYFDGKYFYHRATGEWDTGKIVYVGQNSVVFMVYNSGFNCVKWELPTKGHPQYDEKFASAEGHLRHKS